MTIPAAQLTLENARSHFELAAREVGRVPTFEGAGVVICAGGPFVPSAYVVVRLLRHFGTTLPVEIWHAGQDEIPAWAPPAFEPWGVSFHDIAVVYPARPAQELRSYAIKTAALVHSKQRHTLFLDADCLPLRDLTFLLSSDEYKRFGALFWPDDQHHDLVPTAPIWDLTGLAYQGDSEHDTGLFVIDKQRCWRELSLAQWMNANSTFWYNFLLGDKDTFYVAWRKQGTKCFLAPPCQRYRAIITRHVWTDGKPLVDHRAGTSKYALPKRHGPFARYLAPCRNRTWKKDLYDEVMQRFIVRNFGLHARYLREFAEFQESP